MKARVQWVPLVAAAVVACDYPSGPVKSPVSTVAVGYSSSCALASGQLFCWGNGVLLPTAVDTTRSYTSVTIGNGFACALDGSGAAYCWGANADGQLGDSSRTNRAAPTAVAGGHRFARLTAGDSHTCGLDTGGVAWCWGDNSYGQLGIGTSRDTTVPARVNVGALLYAAISTGSLTTCALSTGGYADCWGYAGSGILGHTITEECSFGDQCSPSPQRVVGGGTYRDISVGSGHVCAVAMGDGIQCWGQNYAGALGVDSMQGVCTADWQCSSVTPVWVTGGGRYASVAAGDIRTCAIAESRDAWCWGYNDAQGYPLREWYYATPQLLQTSARFTQMEKSGHSCGLSTAGEVLCWGSNYSGELGDGTTTYRPTPVRALVP